MTYEELKQIAKPHVRGGENLPSNAFLLLMQLHIPFKNEIQCEKDYNGKMTPLYNSPAFLSIDSTGNKIVYFNSKTRYWNFYIFHEISHHILGHENDCPQNEIDADLLACILTAPVKNLPSHLKSARDLSTLCQIPIDKAEMYWNEIKKEFKFTNYIKSFPALAIIIVLILFVVFIFFYNILANSKSAPQESSNIVYTTKYGEKFHKRDCTYISKSSTIYKTTKENAIKEGYDPCYACIE